MSSRGPSNLSDLDRLIGSIVFPVRAESLAKAWDEMPAPDRTALPAGQVLLIVTMHARPGEGQRLAEAAREFLKATSSLRGALGSTLHGSPDDPETWFLIERFATVATLEQHMASGYFGRFQIVQRALLASPVDAVFLQSGTR